jgi:hypothetical protein
VAKTAVYPNAPALRIFFTYNDTEVSSLQKSSPQSDGTLRGVPFSALRATHTRARRAGRLPRH